jgi:hypothetical protein
MSALEQLAGVVEPYPSEDEQFLQCAFDKASDIAIHIENYGQGIEEVFTQRYFIFENVLHRAMDSALVSILEIEASRVWDEGAITAYKINDAYIFREEHYYDENTPGGALYTGYIDCA